MLVRVPVDLPPPSNDPRRVKGLTQQILRGREFQPPKRSWLQAAWHWLGKEIGKLLSQLLGRGGGFGGSTVAVVVVLAVATVVIGLVVMTMARRGRRRRVAGSPVVVYQGYGSSRTPAEWRAEAALHDAGGRWRDALRCRYRALIAELAGRGLVEEIPGRTSGEYRQDVKAVAPAAGRAFDGATDLFEQAWYGDRPTGRQDQDSFDDLARQVLTPVGGGPGDWDLPR